MPKRPPPLGRQKNLKLSEMIRLKGLKRKSRSLSNRASLGKLSFAINSFSADFNNQPFPAFSSTTLKNEPTVFSAISRDKPVCSFPFYPTRLISTFQTPILLHTKPLNLARCFTCVKLLSCLPQAYRPSPSSVGHSGVQMTIFRSKIDTSCSRDLPIFDDKRYFV